MKTYKEFIKEAPTNNSCLVLVQRLQDSLELFKQLHWNVEGEGFLEIHKLFGDIYAGLQTFQDRIAEKARGMGSFVVLNDSPNGGRIETEESLQVAYDHLNNLRNGLESLRTSDLTIENILGELAEQIDVWLYKLKSSKGVE